MASNGYIEWDDKDAWLRLGEAIARRRQELGLSHREAAKLAESGSATWSVLENGVIPNLRIQRITASKLERVLQWTPGSLEAFLKHGEEPLPLEEHPNVAFLSYQLDRFSNRLSDLEQRFKKLEDCVEELQRLERLLRALQR